MVRFMHFSDTHLGSREYGESFREDDFYEAFQEAINIGMEENVDFFVHSGDLFDTWSPGNHALLKFKDYARQISDAHKRMYIIMGDHDRPKRKDDPASKIFDFLGVKLLDDGTENSQKWTSIEDNGEEVLIYGISNMKGLRKSQLIEEYRIAENEARKYRSSILLSHQAVQPYLHPEACEAKYDELPKTFSYLGFGHIHDHVLRAKDYPVFSYAGSTDMTSSSEIEKFIRQGKGVNLVEINGSDTSVERIPLKSTRFQIEISANHDNYLEEIESAQIKYGDRFGEKKPMFLLTIVGEADREDVKQNLSRLSDQCYFRRVKFDPQKAASVSKPNMSSLIDYFKAYFGEEDMAKLANEVYETLKNDDYEHSRRVILERLGIDFEVGARDN